MFNQSSIDDILKRRAEEQRQKEIIVENVEEYKTALNRLASSPDGKFVLKYLIKYCGINKVKHLNPVQLVEDQGKRNVYYEMFRPYLDKTNLMEIEINE